jgi:drug/metabolite transporter (DMT)-like permease
MTSSHAVSEAIETRSQGPGSSAGYALALLGAVLFSTKSIVIKLAYAAGADAEVMQALRMAISLPIYLGIGTHALLALRGSSQPAPSKAALLSAGGIGLIGYWAASYVDLKGLEYISAQLERLILFTYPFFVILFGAMFLGDKLTWRAAAAFAVSYLGLAVIFIPLVSAGSGDVIGAMLVLVSAITFAVYQLIAKRAVAAMGVRIFTSVSMTAAALAGLVPFVVVHGFTPAIMSPYILALGFALAIGGTVLPSFLFSAALRTISARANATIGILSPIATIVLAFAILGETMTSSAIFGGVLVIAGVAWFSITEHRSAAMDVGGVLPRQARTELLGWRLDRRNRSLVALLRPDPRADD